MDDCLKNITELIISLTATMFIGSILYHSFFVCSRCYFFHFMSISTFLHRIANNYMTIC